MKNWNTDVEKFKTEEDRKIWELVQKITYGVDNEVLSKKEVKQYWDNIKTKIDLESRRLLELCLWGKQYSLPTNIGFWNQPQPVM